MRPEDTARRAAHPRLKKPRGLRRLAAGREAVTTPAMFRGRSPCTVAHPVGCAFSALVSWPSSSLRPSV